jgi:hypothetical protein
MKRWDNREQPLWLVEPLFNALRRSYLKAFAATRKEVADCLLAIRRFDGIAIVTNVISWERVSYFGDYFLRRYSYQEI